MLVPKLLLETLENQVNEDFQKFKWYLSMRVLDDCRPIPKSRLENASRSETVSRMIVVYGEKLAVGVTVKILEMMNCNSPAEELARTYASAVDGGATVAPSASSLASAPPAAPAMISAQHGAVVIAPNVTSSTAGAWNITIHK